MKFKYVQTRQVRYVVIIEAPDMNMADDFVHLHEEWQEERTEECDPPWREPCDQNAPPDLVILKDGTMLTRWDLPDPEKT
jgi:hypothetical protein